MTCPPLLGARVIPREDRDSPKRHLSARYHALQGLTHSTKKDPGDGGAGVEEGSIAGVQAICRTCRVNAVQVFRFPESCSCASLNAMLTPSWPPPFVGRAERFLTVLSWGRGL